jgi:hypothetical protein
MRAIALFDAGVSRRFRVIKENLKAKEQENRRTNDKTDLLTV